MIIDIDHISYCSSNIEEHIEFFKSCGYDLKFFIQKTPNLKIKKKFMKKFSPLQNFALLSSKDNMNVEALNYNHYEYGISYMEPIFENISKPLLNNTKLQVPITILQTKKKFFKFNKVIVKTFDLKKSLFFWEYFGFKKINSKKNSAILQFNSLINNKIYQIHLKKSSNAITKHDLDDIGFNCIAFVSTSLEHDKKTLTDNGWLTSNIENFTINKKVAQILFCRGYCGEIVEIISF